LGSEGLLELWLAERRIPALRGLRQRLTVAQREAFLTFPEQEENLLQYYTLSVRDLATVRQHRGDHNRLGFAVQLCYLRYPGRVLAGNETPPAALLGVVAAQLQVQPALWDGYAQRDFFRHHLGVTTRKCQNCPVGENPNWTI